MLGNFEFLEPLIEEVFKMRPVVGCFLSKKLEIIFENQIASA